MTPPPVHVGDHLVGYLFRVGPLAGGETLTFTEIGSWASQTGVILTPWEVETLRALSGAYGSELHLAKDAKRPAPVDEGEK